MARRGITENEIEAIVTNIVLEIIPSSENLTIQAGKRAEHTKNFRSALGNRAYSYSDSSQHDYLYYR